MRPSLYSLSHHHRNDSLDSNPNLFDSDVDEYAGDVDDSDSTWQNQLSQRLTEADRDEFGSILQKVVDDCRAIRQIIQSGTLVFNTRALGCFIGRLDKVVHWASRFLRNRSELYELNGVSERMAIWLGTLSIDSPLVTALDQDHVKEQIRRENNLLLNWSDRNIPPQQRLSLNLMLPECRQVDGVNSIDDDVDLANQLSNPEEQGFYIDIRNIIDEQWRLYEAGCTGREYIERNVRLTQTKELMRQILDHQSNSRPTTSLENLHHDHKLARFGRLVALLDMIPSHPHSSDGGPFRSTASTPHWDSTGAVGLIEDDQEQGSHSSGSDVGVESDRLRRGSLATTVEPLSTPPRSVTEGITVGMVRPTRFGDTASMRPLPVSVDIADIGDYTNTVGGGRSRPGATIPGFQSQPLVSSPMVTVANPLMDRRGSGPNIYGIDNDGLTQQLTNIQISHPAQYTSNGGLSHTMRAIPMSLSRSGQGQPLARYPPPVGPPPSRSLLRQPIDMQPTSNTGMRNLGLQTQTVPALFTSWWSWKRPVEMQEVQVSNNMITIGSKLQCKAEWSPIDTALDEAIRYEHIRTSRIGFLRIPIGTTVDVRSIWNVKASIWISADSDLGQGLIPLAVLTDDLRNTDIPRQVSYPLHETVSTFYGFLRRGDRGTHNMIMGVAYGNFVRFKEQGNWREMIVANISFLESIIDPEVEVAHNRQVSRYPNMHKVIISHRQTLFELAFQTEEACYGFIEDVKKLRSCIPPQ